MDSNSDHVRIFGAVIGHLEGEIEFLSFHRKWSKFAWPPKFWTPAEILTGRASTTSQYSTGETPPIKVGRPESSSLEVYMSGRQHIYEDLNESSSARPAGSQQSEILLSPNSKRTPNFFAQILARRRNFYLGTEISTPAIVLSYA